MRIGVNTRLLLSENMEGIPRYTFETTKQISHDHPYDEFILFFDRKINVDFKFPANVKKVVIPLPTRHPVLWYIWFEFLLPIYLQKYKIDVFYSPEGYLSLRSKVPTVMVMHDLAYLHFPKYISYCTLKFYSFFIPKYLSKANKVITVSDFVMRDILRKFDLPAEKVVVAYNAVSNDLPNIENDIPAFIQNKLADHPYFIYVGSLHPRKNIIGLIRGFQLFNAKNKGKYRLVLAGRLAWKTDDIRREMEISEDVLYIGMISESVKYHLLSKAVAMTYVSWFEGFGIPLLEAMKSGCPVITSSVTSMPEVANGAALLVNPEDPTSIAHAMSRIAGDIDLRNQLIEKGYSRVRDFKWKESADIIYSKLAEIVH